VLSGGYVDDEDYGSEVIYTGHGGRDPETGRQIADQTFTRQNQALVTSCLQGLPVRVVRGAEHRSSYSPPAGYRYDGLYRVESYWHSVGRDGFSICRFRLISENGFATRGAETTPTRVATTVLRVVRDTALSKRVKHIHQFRCQVCGTRLECEGGWYAEAAHIRPLGSPHHGPDTLDNILCLCPNHHVLFDNGGFTVADDLTLVGIEGRLVSSRDHPISREHLSYHRSISDVGVLSRRESGA
jgi:putative restriction endonuclease